MDTNKPVSVSGSPGSESKWRHEDDICERCRSIDFSKVFPLLKALKASMPKTAVEWTNNPLAQGVFLSDIRDFSPFCRLCFVLQCSRWHFAESSHKVYELRAFSLPKTFSIDLWALWASASETAVWLQLVPRMPTENVRTRVVDAAKYALECGWLACYMTTATPIMLQPQRIPPRFPAASVKKWLGLCRKFHCSVCKTTIHAIRASDLTLIDCKTLQLCQAQPRSQYIALSYVWSVSSRKSVTSDAAPLQDRQLPPWESLSPVIKDSISVTQQLGFQYLWVDRYCIPQRDTDAKLEQIERMDMIYRGAELTIIAAAGLDEHHGLPGVHSERAPQFAVEIGSVTIASVPEERSYFIERSKWATRGWTFQENFLSRRRLFFMDEQVALVCGEMECCEAYAGPEYADSSEEMQHFFEATFRTDKMREYNYITQPTLYEPDLPARSHAWGTVDPLTGLQRLVQAFATKELTYDKDRLCALRGIQKRFESSGRSIYSIQGRSIYSIQGLPIVISSTLSPEDISQSLAAAICWDLRSSDKTQRKPEFPSWTWAGWSGGISFFRGGGFRHRARPHALEFKSGIVLSLQEWAVALEQKQDDRLLMADAHATPIATLRGGDLAHPMVIILDAPDVTEHITFQTIHDWKSVKFFDLHLEIWDSSHTRCTPRFFSDGARAGRISCILLGLTGDDLLFPHRVYAELMILQWSRSDEAQRFAKFTGEWQTPQRQQLKEKLEEKLASMEWRTIRLV